MGKTITQNKSYISLLENTLYELFSPSSKKSLLDYRQLDLIDVDQMKIIDFSQLKLLDTREFRLLDLAVLSVFFQYIGAMFLTLSFGFLVAFSAFTIHSTLNTTVLAEATPVKPSVRPQRVAELVKTEGRTANSGSSGFAGLIETKEGNVEARVLGSSAKTVETVEAAKAAPPIKAVETNSCSFRVVEGEDSIRLSSGSKYNPAKVFKLCVDSNKTASTFDWNIGSEVSSNTSDCVTSYELIGASTLTVTLFDEAGFTNGSCDLSLVKTAQIAVNN